MGRHCIVCVASYKGHWALSVDIPVFLRPHTLRLLSWQLIVFNRKGPKFWQSVTWKSHQEEGGPDRCHMLVFRWYMNLPPEYLLHRYTSTDIYASPHPPTDLWDAYCLTGGWCLLKGETNHKCKLLNISKDHFQNSLQIRFVQLEKYVCPTPLHVSKGHLQNTDTGRNLFPRGCQLAAAWFRSTTGTWE